MATQSHLLIKVASQPLTAPGETFPNEQTAEFIDKLIEELDALDIGEFVKAGGTTKSLEITYSVKDPDLVLSKANEIVGRHVSEEYFSIELLPDESDSDDGSED